MPSTSSAKIAVFLTRGEVQLLRGLIIREARRVDPDQRHQVTPQRLWPSKLRRMWPVARKLAHTLEVFDGARRARG